MTGMIWNNISRYLAATKLHAGLDIWRDSSCITLRNNIQMMKDRHAIFTDNLDENGSAYTSINRSLKDRNGSHKRGGGKKIE